MDKVLSLLPYLATYNHWNIGANYFSNCLLSVFLLVHLGPTWVVETIFSLQVQIDSLDAIMLKKIDKGLNY